MKTNRTFVITQDTKGEVKRDEDDKVVETEDPYRIGFPQNEQRSHLPPTL